MSSVPFLSPREVVGVGNWAGEVCKIALMSSGGSVYMAESKIVISKCSSRSESKSLIRDHICPTYVVLDLLEC